MEPEKIIGSIEKLLSNAVDDLEEAKKIEEKVQLSTIINNLSQSLNIFSTMPCAGYQADDIDENDEAEINRALDEKFL